MGIKKIFIFFCVGVILYSIYAVAFAAKNKDKNTDEDLIVRTEKGLRFKLPKDWPVEKRGGAIGPIPIEEYVALKFDKVNTQLQKIEQSIADLSIDIQELKKLKKEIEGIRKDLANKMDVPH